MKHGRLSDLMLSVGVLDAPGWFDQISLPFWPMPHQMDMVKTYPRNMRYLDAGEPGCVSADTEFLTPTGWKRIDQYVEGDQVAQFHPDDHTMSFTTPQAYIKRPCDEMYVVRPSRGLSMKLSSCHRVLSFGAGGNRYRVDRMDKVAEIHEQQVNGFRGLINTTPTYDGKSAIPLTDEQIRVQVMVLADGTFPPKSSDNACVVRVLKKRKQERCTELLAAAGIPFTLRDAGNGYVRIRFRSPVKEKTYPASWWSATHQQKLVILDEARHWDGTITPGRPNSFRFTSLHKGDVDFIQFCSITTGRNCSTMHRLHSIQEGKTFTEHAADVSSRRLLTGFASSTTKTPIVKEPTEDGFMYCFQVPSSFLVLRREGRVFTTGNCGKTFPAQIHAVLMAALGNKVVFSMPPKLILQFYREFGTFFEGIHSKLKIAHMDVDAGGKKKLLADWEANGWPDILIISYGTFRLLNDIHKGKAIGQNLWKLRKLDSLGAPDEFAAPYFDAEGVAVAPKAQPYTKDGRRIGKDGKAPNPYQLLLKRRGYHVMFFDEAHALCGMDSILSKSISDISEELGEEVAIYLMTGTPIPTHLHDVYGIMRLVNPGAYMGKASFLRQHCITKEFRITIPGKNTQKTISSIVDYIDTDRIYDNLWKNASRVQKRDVMKMPDPVISEVPVKLTGAHRKLYKEVIKNRFAILGENVLAPDNVMQLRHMALQLISCPEHYGFSGENEVAKAAGDLVESIAPCPTRKLIIFAYYKSAMEGLTKQFAHYAPCVVFGETSDAQGQIDAFVNDPARCVLIINWIAGGAGLNLQVASHILFYECPTSPKDAKQAIARADRKGQLKTVNVYFLRVLDTLSDKNFKSLLKNEESNNRGIKDKHDLLHELMIA